MIIILVKPIRENLQKIKNLNQKFVHAKTLTLKINKKKKQIQNNIMNTTS